MIDLSKLTIDSSVSDKDLISAYAQILDAMRKRGIIRTKNVVGELGEKYAEYTYVDNSGLPSIKLLSTNSKNIDAIDDLGRTYNIKSLSGKIVRTGSFHLNADHSFNEKAFDYLLVVILDESMNLVSIFEFSWEQFWKFKRWSKTQKAWFISLTKSVLSFGKKVYNRE
jgi:hypothetical protein